MLTPRRLLTRHLTPSTELDHALGIARRFDISREAAARRYVALHDECLAAVFLAVRPDPLHREARWVSGDLGLERRSATDEHDIQGTPLTSLDEVALAAWLA